MSIEEVAEKLGLEVEEVKAWEESDDEIPDTAVELIKSERENRSADQIETEE
jgi:DNA-binding transcriptional regulator YiaG